jgi:hypothetical protein
MILRSTPPGDEDLPDPQRLELFEEMAQARKEEMARYGYLDGPRPRDRKAQLGEIIERIRTEKRDLPVSWWKWQSFLSLDPKLNMLYLHWARKYRPKDEGFQHDIVASLRNEDFLNGITHAEKRRERNRDLRGGIITKYFWKRVQHCVERLSGRLPGDFKPSNPTARDDIAMPRKSAEQLELEAILREYRLNLKNDVDRLIFDLRFWENRKVSDILRCLEMFASYLEDLANAVRDSMSQINAVFGDQKGISDNNIDDDSDEFSDDKMSVLRLEFPKDCEECDKLEKDLRDEAAMYRKMRRRDVDEIIERLKRGLKEYLKGHYPETDT